MSDVTLVPPFTLKTLVHLTRIRLDDLPGDIDDPDSCWDNGEGDDGLLWRNTELCSYADEAQFEFCLRRPIKDWRTAAVCNITVAASIDEFAYHESILAIERARFVETASGKEHPLRKSTHKSLDQLYPKWQTAADGEPTDYIEDTEERRIILYPAPALAGTLYLTVQRLPLLHFNWNNRETQRPVIPNEHQWALIDFMMHRAYMKRDAETDQPDLAKQHLDAFDAKVGVRPSAHLQKVRRMERNSYRRVRAQFF